jgi:hypothetical protein
MQMVRITGLCVAGCLTAALAVQAQDTAESLDPFAVLAAHRGQSPAQVPPRALAVIPERHTGRVIRIRDVLDRIEPQLDDLAAGAGLSGARAIQIMPREARVPVFVEKTGANISTLLQIPLGTEIEITGVLVARGSRYLFFASEVRPAPQRGRRP